jgi:chaperonin GroES
MRLVPLGDRVAIRAVETEDKIGSLYIPDSAKQRSTVGEITAVGKECKECKVGMLAVYGKYSGQYVIVSNEELMVIKEADLLAVFMEE